MRVTMGRVASGIMGGLVGGLAFGALMLTHFTIDQQMGRTGMVQLVQQFLGTTSPGVVWSVHVAVSVALGIVYSVLMPPRGYARNVVAGVAFALVVGVLGSWLVLRTLLGVGLSVDAALVFALAGHLVYGVCLGLVYVAFHDLEVREALSTTSARLQRWGRREDRRT